MRVSPVGLFSKSSVPLMEENATPPAPSRDTMVFGVLALVAWVNLINPSVIIGILPLSPVIRFWQNDESSTTNA